MSIRESLEQLRFLHADLSAIVNGRWYRWLTMWMFYGSAPALLKYRISRCLYLLIGESFATFRLVLAPLFLLLRLLGPSLDIRYGADIGPGFKILHPAMGALVSAQAVCGRGLILAGGNWIVLKTRPQPGHIRIGDNVELRANAIVLGPVSVGDRSVIGAGAVVVSDCPPGSVMVGAPARRLDRDDIVSEMLEPKEALGAIPA